VVYALALAVAVSVKQEAINPGYCTGNPFGYVRVVKDGYRIAGGSATYDPRTALLTTAFQTFGDERGTFTLRLNPVRVHADGVRVIIQQGIFCAYSAIQPRL